MDGGDLSDMIQENSTIAYLMLSGFDRADMAWDWLIHGWCYVFR